MTWLKAPEVNWHELGKKGRGRVLADFINNNPVINQQNSIAVRYVGETNEVRQLKDRIFDNCQIMLKSFVKPNSAIESKELQLKLMQFITEEIIKQHIRKMLNDDFYEKSKRDDFRPGCVYHPAHFYVAKFDFWDDTIEFFDAKYKNSIYAEFYNEFQDYEDRPKTIGEKVKRRRPILLVDDQMFVKVEAIPCSANPSPSKIKVKILGAIRFSFAVPHFLFTVTPAMLRDDKSAESVGKADKEDLKTVIRNLPRRKRW